MAAIAEPRRSKEAWCKNCGEQIFFSDQIASAGTYGLDHSSVGWWHKLSEVRKCFQPIRLMAEPDRDRSSEPRKQSDSLDHYDIGGEG